MSPIRWRMVHPAEVHELVNQDVVAHGWRHEDEPPVECDVSVPPARSPPRALIADAHSREAGDAVLGREFPDSDRQFSGRPRPQGDPFCGVDGRSGYPGALGADPLEVTCGKRLGLAFRTAARDRHPQLAVGFNPKKISPGASVADEIQGGEGDARGCEGDTRGCERDTRGCEERHSRVRGRYSLVRGGHSRVRSGYSSVRRWCRLGRR